MNKQEQIDALRFRIGRIEAKLAQEHKGNNFGNAQAAEPDPYQVDWSNAPEWADVHAFDADMRGWWYGSEMCSSDWKGFIKPSLISLNSNLDWKQSKRRRAN